MKSVPSRLIAAVALTLGFLKAPAPADVLYWDFDANAVGNNYFTGVGLGGAGAWNPADLKWWTGLNGTDAAWNNSHNDTAFFWGTAGTVTMGADYTVGGLTFATTAYTLDTGGHTLTFANPVSTVWLRNVAAATIAGALSGTGAITVTDKVFGGQTAGTLTLTGSGANFTGGVTISNGMTVSLSGASGTTFSNISDLTLNGGNLTLTNSTGQGGLDRVNNLAPIFSNGGTITYTNTASSTNSYAETLGVLTLNSGRLNVIATNANTSPSTQALSFSGFTRSATSTATLAIGGGSVGANAQNRVLVTGMAATAAGQIVGPWATYGASAAAQTDYAIYDTTNGFKGAAIAASAENTWTTAANAYTLNAATTLTGTRTMSALRFTGTAPAELTLATGMNLETCGLLNGSTTASATFSVGPGTGGSLTTPAGGGKLYFMTGGSTTAAITVTAPIIDNNGAVTVVNSGASTLTLGSAANSFSGGLVINGGTVAIASDANLGNVNGGITFNGTGALSLTAASILAATRTITINNTALATISTGGLVSEIAGKVTGSGGLIVTAGGTTTFSNTANDFEGILRIANSATSTTANFNSLADSATANGAIRLGNSTSSGTFVWNTGVIANLTLNNRQIDLAGTTGGGSITNNATGFTITINTDLLVTGSGAKTLSLAGTGNGVFNGRIDGSGSTIGVTKTGTGTWTLTGDNSFTGNVGISQGTLVFSTASNLGSIATIANINLGNTSTVGGTLQYVGAGDSIADKIVLNTTTATNTINASGTGALIFTDTAAITAGAGVKTFTLTGTNTDANEIRGILQNNNSTNLTNLSKTGTGTWVLSGVNTYNNTTIGSSTLPGGILRLSGAGTLGTGTLSVLAGTLEMTGTADQTVTGITMGGGAVGSQSTITIGAGRTLNLTGGLTYSATNNNLTSTIQGGPLDLAGASRTINVGNSTSVATDLVISSAIANDGGAGVIKTGLGTLQLSGSSANTYTGGTTVSQGILELNKTAGLNSLGTGNVSINSTSGLVVLRLLANEQIADTASVALNSTSTSNFSNLDLNGFTETIGGLTLTTVTGAGATVITGNGGKLIVQGNLIFNNDRNASGNSARDILITGAGTDAAASPNTGFLDLAGGVRTITVASIGAAVDADATIETIIQNGGIIKEGSRVLVLSGDNTYTGGTTINNGTIRIGAGSTTGAILGNVLNNGTLEFNRSNAYTFAGDITGSGTVIKSAGGVLTLSGANAYSGATSINAGTVEVFKIGNAGSATDTNLGTNAVINMGSGSTAVGLLYSGAGETTDKVLTLTGSTGTVSITSSGTGALVFTSNLAVPSTTSTKTFALTGTNTAGNTFAGVIPDSSGTGLINLSKTGAGTWILTGANTYTGTTIVNGDGGVLRLDGAGKISAGALTVNAGNLEILATGQDQTIGALSMGGGAAGASSTINIGAGRKLTLGGDVTFSATNNNLTATITGGAGALFDFGGLTRTFNIANSTGAGVDMLIDTNVTLQNGGLIKIGAGTLVINGVNNLNSVDVQAGALLGNIGSSNLLLNGGTYESNGTFTRNLGTGLNEVQWAPNANGGFSANGGPLTVTLNGGSTLTWDSTPFFVSGTGQLLFGSTSADDVTTFTNNLNLNGGNRTIQVVDNTVATTDRATLSGVLSNGSLTKSGNGTLRLGGANAFTGNITVTQGTLEFSTVSNNGGAPSNLGQGTDGLVLNGGTLSFVGDTTSQSTNRAITVAAASTLAANGTNGAVITYAGLISPAADIGLTLGGTGSGIISGGITQPAGLATADLTVVSGDWKITGVAPSIADDLIVNGGTLTLENVQFGLNDDVVVTGPTAILNLNSADVLKPLSAAGTSSGLYARGGAVINLNANDVNGVANANGLDFILLGDGTTLGAGTLNMNTFRMTTPRLDLGAIADGYSGVILGTGTLSFTYTGTDYQSGIRLFRGSIAANLAGVSTILKQGLFDVTLSGDNSGLSSTVAATRLDSGNLILDYATDNHNKISSDAVLDMRGGTLTLSGGVLANTTQNVASLTLANGGANQITVGSAGGFTTTLNVGAITRANSAGTLRIVTSAAGSLVTSTSNNATTGLLGATGTAYATIDDGTGTYFAINDGTGKIVALTYAGAKNDVSTWQAGDNVTDATTGFTGTVNRANINSLRFDAAGSSTVTIDPLGVLTIASGGVLQTDNVTGPNTVITGGQLVAAAGELVVTTDSATSLFRISSRLAGSMGLTKTGVGTLVLDSTNTYSGATQIQNGLLRISGGNAIGDRSTVTLSDDHDTTLEVLNDETIGALAGGSVTTGLSTLAQVDLGTRTLTINGTTAATYSGLLTGSGRIIKTGTAIQSFGGTSTFTGDLIVNRGQVTLATRTIANFSSIASLTINNGVVLLDYTGGTESSPNKLNNSAPVTMINTGSGDGLRANNDRNDASKAETIGALTFLGGANTITVSASSTTGTTQRSMTITAASIARSNRSTLLVRGQNLGTTLTAAPLNPIHTGRFVSTAAPTLTGGAGGAGTTSIAIVPWAIGSNSITGAGESLVTYAATTGFRPLDLTTEYEQLIAAGGVTAANNVRWSSAADLTLDGSTARTMNALLLENTGAQLITLNGAGAALNVAAGAFLMGGTQPVALGGFSGITTGALNEYIFHVTNTSTAGATVNSPFTSSAAALTKSGTGTLTLTATGSTYTGPTTVNQGILQIDALNKLGNSGSGGIAFNGGTLRFGAAFDISLVPVTFGVTSTLTVDQTAGGTLDTNGFDIVLANAIGGGANGGMTKTGSGTLTLNAAVTYTGSTTVNGGTLLYGVAGALPANMDLILGGGVFDQANFTSTLGSLTLNANSTIAGSADLTFTGDVEIDGGASRTLTVNNSGDTIFSSGLFTLVNVGTTGRTLTLAGTGDVTIQSSIADGTVTGTLTITKSGLTILSGQNTYSGTTTLNAAAGTLVLSGRNTSSGATTLTTGTLQLDGAINGGLASGTLTLSAGTVQALNQARAVSNATLLGGTVTISGSQALTFNGSFTNNAASRTLISSITGNLLTLAGPVYLSESSTTGRTLTIGGSGDTTISGAIANFNGSGAAGAFIYTGTGLLTLSGANTYTGNTTIGSAGSASGTVRVTSGSNVSSANLTIFGGTLDLLNGNQALTALTMGNGPLGSTAAIKLNGGTLSLNNNVTVTASTTAGTASIETGTINLLGDRTFAVNDSTAVDVDLRITSVIADGDATARAFIKSGNGTLVLDALNTYTGATSINQGVLRFTQDHNLVGALQFGSTTAITTAGILDLSTASVTTPTFTVQTNSTSVNNLIIGAAETLTVNGNVNIGSSAGTTTTLFAAQGGGRFVAENTATNGVFQVGGANTTTTNGNRASADLSGLSELAVNLNTSTGTFRVNPSSGGNAGGRYATLILPSSGLGKTTITANLLAIGDGVQYNGGTTDINTLLLGSGENIVRVNTINIGTGTRDMGAIAFNAANGSVDIRRPNDTGTTFNMGTTGGGTGAGGGENVFDVSGHQADLLFAAVNIGTQNRFAAYSNTFSFNQGNLDMASLTMSTRTGGSTTTGVGASRDVVSTMNLGGGTVIMRSGILSLASVSGAYNADTNLAPVVTGIVNITGGNVTIGVVGTVGTNAITMASATATTTGVAPGTPQAIASVNITGGQVTVNGNIVRGTVSGNSTATGTVLLDGGSLDMTGKTIGTATNPIALDARSGTLKNLNQLNGGGDLTKTTAGTLIIEGVNVYTGETIINAGIVLVNGSISGNVAVNNSGTLGGTNGTVGAVTVHGGGTLAPGNSAGILTTGNLSLENAGTLSLELGPTAAGSGYDQVKVSGGVTLGGELKLTLLTGFADQIGDTFYVVLNNGSDAVSGLFSNVTTMTATTGTLLLANGRQFLVNYAANAPLGDGGGNDISLTVQAVPEPGAWSMLAASFGVGLGLQRFRRRRGLGGRVRG